MQLFSAFDIPQQHIIHNTTISQDTASIDLSDPDEMYARWIAPSMDIFDDIPQNEWRKEINDVHEIFLELKKTPQIILSHSLLKEMSIQVSIYEALIFRELLLNSPNDHWSLSKTTANTLEKKFKFSSKNTTIITSIQGNTVSFIDNGHPIGTLTIDMEHVIIEKLHGQLFGKPFVLDPIWLRKQKKVDAVKLQIEQFHTEIVHKRHHKDTVWTGGSQPSRMTISTNESLSINKQLILNIKKIHWKKQTLTTLQWITPWVRLPIHGLYKLIPN